jgi:hypothetical protein
METRHDRGIGRFDLCIPTLVSRNPVLGFACFLYFTFHSKSGRTHLEIVCFKIQLQFSAFIRGDSQQTSFYLAFYNFFRFQLLAHSYLFSVPSKFCIGVL